MAHSHLYSAERDFSFERDSSFLLPQVCQSLTKGEKSQKLRIRNFREGNENLSSTGNWNLGEKCPLATSLTERNQEGGGKGAAE